MIYHHHDRTSYKLALRAEIGPGMWHASITSQTVSRLPQAALKILHSPGQFQSRKSSQQHHWSQKQAEMSCFKTEGDWMLMVSLTSIRNQEDLERIVGDG